LPNRDGVSKHHDIDAGQIGVLWSCLITETVTVREKRNWAARRKTAGSRIHFVCQSRIGGGAEQISSG
jgi:hypothetical protein